MILQGILKKGKTARLTILAMFFALCMSSFSTIRCSNASDSPLDTTEDGNLNITSEKSLLTRDSNPQVDSADLDALVLGNNQFALELYQKAQEQMDNFFFSPFSISMAFAMVYAGAKENTKAEIETAMNFTLEDPKQHEAFNQLDLALEAYNDPGKLQLNIVNQTWGQSGWDFMDPFLDTLAINYGAGMNLLDYVSDPESARLTINQWVEDQTNDRIKDLLAPGDVGQSTRLVLTNAIYFLAQWATVFEKDLTTDQSFFLNDGSSVSVATMQQTEEFRYADLTDANLIDMPYVGNDLAMLIILPKDGKWGDVEQSLTAESISDFFLQLETKNVHLTLPKWSIESDSMELTSYLNQLGMVEPFTSSADFSGIDGSKDLFISKVKHKAFINVDENGTEAAAATAIVVDVTSVPSETIEMPVNRPFIFIIHDTATPSILFMGRVLDPSNQ